jgi:uncharacterized protein (TIGR01777 family)
MKRLAGHGERTHALPRALPRAALDGCTAVVHLAGEPVAQRWTASVKERIRMSRVEGTRLLVEEIKRSQKPPSTLVCASAIGYYGDRGDEILRETSPPGADFLASSCLEWERAARGAEEAGTRVTSVRIGIVLGNGGALSKMLPPFRLGLGGPLGSGRQWMSWVHIDDLVELVLLALKDPRISGPLNGVAPEPVRNSEFTKALAAALHRPAFMPVPVFGLRLLFGEMATVMIASQRVIPEAASQAGFQFRYQNIRSALGSILNNRSILNSQ